MRSEWKEKRLGDVADVTTGQSAPQGRDLFGDKGHPFVRAGSLDFLCNGGEHSQLEHLTDDVAANYRMRLFPADTIVFAKSGMSATKGLVFRLNVPSYVVSHLAAVLPSEKVIPEYMEHWLRTNPPSRLISNEAYPSIRTSQINDMLIRHPETTDEQRRIAAILDKADAIRRKRREAIRLLDDFLRATFLDMFGDPVTNPKGWDRSTVGKETYFITSGSRGWAQYYAEAGSLFIRIQNLKSGFLDLSDIAYVVAPDSAEAARTRVQPGDVLLSITADLGRTGVVPELIGEAFVNQHLAILRFSTLNPVFVSHLLATPGGQAQFARLNRSAVKAGLNFNDIRSIDLLIPPRVLQDHFAIIVRTIEIQKTQLMNSMIEADTLRMSLSQRAFVGELHSIDSEQTEKSISFALPKEKRINANDPSVYLIQFVILLLREAGGSMRLIDIARAYTLLNQQDRIRELAVGSPNKSVIDTWSKKYTERIDESLFGITIQKMASSRKEIIVREDGEGFLVSTTQFASIPGPIIPWRQLDAQIMCWAISTIPQIIFEENSIAPVVYRMTQAAIAA